MATSTALQIAALILFGIGLLLWVDDGPHRRKDYQGHGDCDVCRKDRP